MKKHLLTFLLAILLSPLMAQTSEVFVSDGKAIGGYDPVAYFKEHKPVKGREDITYSWDGATWSFANKENLASFKADPKHYAPQYGGYCAYGTAQSHKSPTKPDAWTIVDDKLYLNYNLDVRSEWNKNQSEFIKQADKNWAEVKKQ